jgi:glucokinase
VLVAGVDIGGTNITVGAVEENHAVAARAKTNTPTSGPDELIDTVLGLIEDLDVDIAAVGVGIPGAVQGNVVVQVPNLEGWNESIDVAGQISERLDLPVALGNDANVGLLGEWVAGSAEGCDNVLGVWMGTGIGGGLILDGAPFNGALGAAGEIGHVIIRAGGAMCTCGRRGCVEAYAGRRSMAATAHSMMERAGRHSRLFEIQEEQGKTRPTSKVWVRALEEEDQLAVKLFSEAVEAVGIGVASVVNVLDLQRVVVGGGLAEKLGQSLADRIGTAAMPWILAPSPDLEFVAAALGDDSGIVGAAAVGRARLVGK